MKQQNLDRIHEFWSKSLGCKKQVLKKPKSGIFSRQKPSDYTIDHTKEKVDVFFKESEKIVSCHESSLSQVRELDFSRQNLQEERLDVKEILGPAFLSFTDSESFKPVKSPDCRKLKESDAEKLEDLKESGQEEEIENSIGDYNPVEHCLFGKFLEGRLVAVSGYEIWNGEIAFLIVFVSKEYRGKGFGKQVVSEAAQHAISHNLIPCYRTVEGWKSSINLAKSLGFEKYASTYLIEIKGK